VLTSAAEAAWAPVPLARGLAGLALAAAIALAARRARSLTRGGAAAAVAVGTASVAAGWAWGATLIAFFVASTLLSRVGRATKEARTRARVEKGDERDAWQVVANGGVFAAAALAALAAPGDTRWAAAGLGALAAATADTWATEIGTLARGRPRSLLGWRAVPVGTSGAVSAQGSAGMVAGAAFLGLVAWGVGFPPRVAGAAFAAGLAGAVADSLAGATVQARRWCDRCDSATERTVHDCGAATRPAGGLGWLDNDAVNVLCTLVGALVGWRLG
jgi:uncharacterized protein (TIGR00297 family)